MLLSCGAVTLGCTPKWAHSSINCINLESNTQRVSLYVAIVVIVVVVPTRFTFHFNLVNAVVYCFCCFYLFNVWCAGVITPSTLLRGLVPASVCAFVCWISALPLRCLSFVMKDHNSLLTLATSSPIFTQLPAPSAVFAAFIYLPLSELVCLMC